MTKLDQEFKNAYEKLNKAQKEAVDSIGGGPVMVVAGPGTGKTRILALRIANILLNGGGEANEILSLTFTNSGVKAMKSRLLEYIGTTANEVRVSTFHAFAIELIEEHYELLSFDQVPSLLTDDEAVFLVDDILQNNTWEYIRPRANPALYFNDIKQLISLLKRERLEIEKFSALVQEEIDNLKNDPESLSSRGESKGKIKKEVEKKIESLTRTLEVVEFYKLYEEKKREMFLMDYDDVLEYAVRLVEEYEDVRNDIREKYLYVLVDEHQDSSGIQNSFLKAVWSGVEAPNIFVVGDDRQLIYGFSGASLSYFEEFSHIFGKAKKITLTENYRSRQNILDLSDDLLKSSISTEKLHSNQNESEKKEEKVGLFEYSYPRDEILAAGLYFKELIDNGMPGNECAILVPKNRHARSAISILEGMGLDVSSGRSISLFEVKESQSFLRILQIIANPNSSIYLSESLLDSTSGIERMDAYKFLNNCKPSEISIIELKNRGDKEGLFGPQNSIARWGEKLENWINVGTEENLATIVSKVGDMLLIKHAKNHEELLRNVEVVRSFIHLAIVHTEKNKNSDIGTFVEYFNRLESYGTPLPLATFGKESGIQVLTLHKSKGLEYEAVWIAHMNEEVFMSEKKNGFTLPEKLKNLISSRDREIAKRELYVAITRAKDHATISYAKENYTGGEMELAHIIRELPEVHFAKKGADITEKELIDHGPEIFTEIKEKVAREALEELKNFVRENYADAKISVTLLNNFFECPWKWYFRNFLKLPEIKSVSLALGSAVHSAIEFILNEPKIPPISKIEEKIIYFLEKEGVNDSKELKRLLKDGISAVERYLKDFYPKLEKDYKSERSLQFRDSKFPHLLMYGKLDLTERTPDGEISVTDFKTGSSKTKGVIEKLDEENRLSSFMRQLAMYSYLIESTEKKKVNLSKLLFLEASKEDKNVLFTTHVGQEQIDLLLKDIKDYDSFLKDGSWVERPCNKNSYGKDQECKYCKMAEMYK